MFPSITMVKSVIKNLDSKKEIMSLLEQGKTIRAISNSLKISKSTIGRISKLYNRTGKFIKQEVMGRPKKTSPNEARIISRIAFKDRFKTAAQITREINSARQIPISSKTVGRRLNEVGLFARSLAKKLLITKKNRKRLHFAQNHILWDANQWSKLFFSDKGKFNLFGSDGKTFVRIKKEERFEKKCTKNTVKFGGSVMVFGMFSWNETSPLVRLNCKVNAAIYKNVLAHHVIPHIERSLIENPVFMQDNVPCHKAKCIMDYLADQDFEIIDWPAQSLDLNPIKNMW